MDIVCFFGGHVTLPDQSATGIQRPIIGFNDFGAKSVETKMPDVDARKKVRYRLFWNWTGTRGIMT